MTANYEFDIPCAWAIQALSLQPTPSVDPVLFSAGTNFWGMFGHGLTADMNPSFASPGDLLVAGLVVSASSVTPPSGWTALPPIVGAGTNGVRLFTFWKIAVSGDLTAPQDYTLDAGEGVGGVWAWEAGTFDATALVTGTNSSVSSGDGTSAPPPLTPIAHDYVIEIVGYRSVSGANPSASSFPDGYDGVRVGQAGGGWHINAATYQSAAVQLPLRLRQRDDALGPVGTPRLSRFQTSLQGSMRLTGYR